MSAVLEPALPGHGRKRAVFVFAAFLLLTGGNARAQGSVDEDGTVSLFPAQLKVRTVVRAMLSDPDGIRSLAWQWAKSSDKATWTDIDRATQADYTPTDSDRGKYLRATALLHDSTAARVGALFQLLVQDTTAQDFGLPSSAIRLRM